MSSSEPFLLPLPPPHSFLGVDAPDSIMLVEHSLSLISALPVACLSFSQQRFQERFRLGEAAPPCAPSWLRLAVCWPRLRALLPWTCPPPGDLHLGLRAALSSEFLAVA